MSSETFDPRMAKHPFVQPYLYNSMEFIHWRMSAMQHYLVKPHQAVFLLPDGICISLGCGMWSVIRDFAGYLADSFSWQSNPPYKCRPGSNNNVLFSACRLQNKGYIRWQQRRLSGLQNPQIIIPSLSSGSLQGQNKNLRILCG